MPSSALVPLPSPVRVWRFDRRGGGAVIPLVEAQSALGHDLVWVHLDYGHADAIRWLSEESGLSELTVRALMADEPRPRLLTVGNGLLAILRGINTNEGADPEDMVSLRVWLDPDRIITVRRRRLASIAEIGERLKQGEGPRDTGDFLCDAAEGMVERIGETVGAFDDACDALESAMLDAGTRELRSKISELRRDVIAVRRYLAPQRDVMGRLPAERVEWLSDVHRARLREVGDRTTRCLEDLEAIRDRAMVTQEELNNRIAEQMNQTMYVLSIVAAIFLPLGLLTGLLGINVGGIPGTESPYAFWAVTIALVGLGVALASFFRSRHLL